MVECDNQSKLIRKSLENENNDVCTVSHIGKDALIINKIPCDRGIKELVRIIDSHRVMRKICDDKFREHSDNIDVLARNQIEKVSLKQFK